MKKIIAVAAVLLALGFAGCKKAETEPVYYCKNTCYLCYDSRDPSRNHNYCNTDYSEAQFQQRIFDDSLVGYICKEVQPTIFNEVSGNNSQAHIDSQQANRLNCYDKRTFFPQYFDYPSFYVAYVERSNRCTKCYDSIAQRYLDIYLDSLDSYIGGFENCPECFGPNDRYCYDTLMPYAVAKINALGMHCGITSGPLYARPGYMTSYLRRLQYEPVTAEFTQDDKDEVIMLNSWLDFNPKPTTGMDDAAIFRECP
ncbi:MAG: hypothetical protein V4615_11605 [Bacteroidota bacterium]